LEHNHCLNCGQCIPQRFNLVLHRGGIAELQGGFLVCFSCPGCGAMVAAEGDAGKAQPVVTPAPVGVPRGIH
jgi:hypothetical protein